ncbi:putative BTB/POZ domain and WD-repeat protein [Powai lake megavirus]|uniref:Putative BTB/POZ domain and WD-repeat protein n=1 Tax=Powai lake megavirus TaxID=1842663 RepID=A0A167RQA1_9VIRU|nr:putative BTB/POZ domain and WD-repeat protein [Powai lake megavirus]ANB51003.1 putative BTB/POZ domain and WD-repeat protein [Powai lake megavirus]
MNNLHILIEDNVFSDVTLEITDDSKTISIKAHKSILYISCDYFRKLLTGFREADLDIIKIPTGNTDVFYDIIMSFYGINKIHDNTLDWKYFLELCKCQDFLGLKIDIDTLTKLKVPSEGFELLLDVIDLIGYKKKLIKLIVDNLPAEYDLSNFPIELLNKISEMFCGYFVIFNCHHSNRTINYYNTITKKTTEINSSPYHIFFIPKNYTIVPQTNDVIYFNNDHIISYNLNNNNIQSSIIEDYNLSSSSINIHHPKYPINRNNNIIGYCPINDIIAISYIGCCYSNYDYLGGSYGSTFIIIYDRKTNEFKKKLEAHRDKITCLVFSPDGNYLASGDYGGRIIVWNIKKNNYMIFRSLHTHAVKSISFSSNSERLVSRNTNFEIKIWKMKKPFLIKEYNFEKEFGNLNYVCFSHNNSDNLLLSCMKIPGINVFDINTSNIIGKQIESDNIIISFCYTPDHKYIIYNERELSLLDKIFNQYMIDESNEISDYYICMYDITSGVITSRTKSTKSVNMEVTMINKSLNKRLIKAINNK